MRTAALVRSHTRLDERYANLRARTEALCAPLETEDYVVQSMPDASPAKWHLAHTSWFFETFVLEPFVRDYRPFHPAFRTLFNSYYESVGPQHARPARGLLTRPTVAEIYAYRRHVDEAMQAVLRAAEPECIERTVLGIEHEQQHQELLLTDLQHAFWSNPLLPVYAEQAIRAGRPPAALRFCAMAGGVVEIGAGERSFAFDNERPRHEVILHPFELADRWTSNGEYLAFMADDGYERQELWLTEGCAFRREHDLRAPLYWFKQDGEWYRYSLHGVAPVVPDEPVCHLSFYEADAFARWSGARLPTEAEWEFAQAGLPVEGHFQEAGYFLPRMSESGFGSVWTWTASPYVGYPRFRPASGSLGEYNGKFMANQWVLRGGSCFTPREGVRPTYRNFFPATARWQVSGIRLAKDEGVSN